MSKTNISLKAEIGTRANATEYLKSPGDAVLVQRGTPRWLVLRCPCGCGEEIPVNLDPRAGKAWRLYRGTSTGLTLFPSVWRDTGCQSHFVVWRDRILLFSFGNASGSSPRDVLDLATLTRRVLDAWPRNRFASYVEVADAMSEIPWDIQEACQSLVKIEALVESVEQKGSYRRATG